MASPDVLDFAKLSAPISAEKPTGADPRGDISPTSLYYQIKGARSDARAAERQAGAGGDANPPDWDKVRQLCIKVLADHAKDLEVTAYLIEALLRLKGFAGMRDGFRLAREFVEKFWDGLFPLPDEDRLDEQGRIVEFGIEARVAPLLGLNGGDTDGTLIAPITRVPMTEVTSLGQFTLATYNEGNSLKKITDAKALAQKVDAGAVTLEMFNRAVGETKPAFYLNLVDDLKTCNAEFAKLGEALDKRCGPQAPPTSNIRNALTAYLGIVQEVAREKLRAASELASTSPTKEDAPAAGAAAAPAVQTPAPGVIQTREQALEALLKVADFFRRTEPHSPVPYALDQVVRWGRMPLPELLTELIADDAPRKSLFKQVGIRVPEEAPKGAAPKK